MTAPAEVELAALPPALRAFEAERAARRALEQEVATLAEQNRRLEHLVREFRRALHGRKSEKLSADERQLAFEDLEAAVAEVEAAQAAAGASRPGLRREKVASSWCQPRYRTIRTLVSCEAMVRKTCLKVALSGEWK
jgi:transposase